MTENKYLPPHDEPEWGGYTLDELRYHRALTLARIEIEKERITMSARQMYSNQMGHMPGMRGSGVISKLLSALTIADYAVIGIKIMRKLSAIYRSSRKE